MYNPINVISHINLYNHHHSQDTERVMVLPFRGFSRVCVCVRSHVQLFTTPWTVAHQAPLSMGFSRQQRHSKAKF